MMPKLRVVASNGAPAFVAPRPSVTGQPGERSGECVGVQLFRRGNKTQAILTFDIDGQSARMWIEIPTPITATCRYMRLVTLALGSPPEAGTPIHPENDGLFKGKHFRVYVGWRKSDTANGKHRFDDSLAASGPKDTKDFLRVHDLLDRVDP